MQINKSTTNLYEEIEKRIQYLQKMVFLVEKRIEKAPEGSIRYIIRKGFVQYYVRKSPKDKSGRYVKKSELALIRAYLQKYYDVRVLKALKKEQAELEKLIKSMGNGVKEIRLIYEEIPELVRSEINPIDYSDEEYANKWLAIPYEGKTMVESGYDQKTDKGEYVRSKSELNIANALYKRGIPYKYECPLKLRNGAIIYPDFTVLNVRERKIVYWEHRGMMDDRDYARHTVMRMKEYMKNDIYLGDNLVITEEIATLPLGTKEIDAVIQHYLI